MLTAAALSFLGAGVAPQTTVGNAMISTSRSRRRAAPHVGLAPGVAFALTALAFRIVSATLRDVADPRGWAPRDPCAGGRFHGA